MKILFQTMLVAVASIWGAVAANASERPNILFIIVDDQSPFDLKPYSPDSQLDAPNIEKLARQGMVIENAYQMGSWVGAVCTASRHMVMSGRTVWHIPNKRGRKENPNSQNTRLVPAGLEENTLAAVFNRAGYDTMRTCKKGNSYEGANKQFQVRRDASKRGGTAESGSAWHAQQVLDYLGERDVANDEDPFLIYFGFSHPHDTRDGTPELLAKYGATNHTDMSKPPALNSKQPPLPINYLPAHPFHHGQPGLRDEEKVSGVWHRRDEATIRNEIGRQFACSENIDIQIGRVLDKLQEMGELDNTYVVYTSDHGMAIGRHGLQGKQNLYDHTWRVPMIVKGPGIEAGARAKGNVYLLDTLATLCDLAGVKAPPSNEGTSFRPVLDGKETQTHEVLYGVYSGGTKPGMRCVQRGDWKLVKYDCLDGTVRKTQLFNMKQNPNEFLDAHRLESVQFLAGCEPGPEQSNLAGKPEYAEKLAEMEALLLSEMQRLDDPYRMWDQDDIQAGQVPPEKSKTLFTTHYSSGETPNHPGAKENSNGKNVMSAASKNLTPHWVPGLGSRIAQYKVASNELSEARAKFLAGAAEEIASALQKHDEVALNFICTHNSRRSHLSQLWAAIACHEYSVPSITSVSGGTEATACNERIVRSLRRAGLSVVTTDPTADNPRYFAQFDERTPPVELFSKTYDDSYNPSTNFFAMMCCSDADDKCPIVSGAIGRVALHYDDPKIADGTSEEGATYDNRRDQIGAEMFFLIRQVAERLKRT